MAGSPSRSKDVHHVRSLSYPPTSNQLTTRIDENLSLASPSQINYSLSSFKDRISAIKELYHDLDDCLSPPHKQQIISHEVHEKSVDLVLDAHIKVLDCSNTAKDLFSQLKHNVQDLLSALRRKDVPGVHVYVTSRKHSIKMIQKSLRDIRSSRSRHPPSSDNELMCLFQEAESATFDMLESLFSYVTGIKTQAGQSGWSLVSKLMMQSNKVSQQDQNEFLKVDAFLKTSHDNDAKIVNHLKEMESRIQLVEEELECFFRQLIKTRVSVLNSLNY